MADNIINESIRQLYIRLGVLVAPGTEKVLRRYDDNIEHLKVAMLQYGDILRTVTLRTLKWALAIGTVSVIAVERLVRRSTEMTETIVRQSEALQVNRQEYQRLEGVFRRYSIAPKQMVDALSTLVDRAVDASQGTQSMIDDFKLLGLSVSQIRGLKPAELFRTFADKVQTTTNKNKALAATVRLLGDDVGRQLFPLLLKGSKGIELMADRVEALGAVMSDKMLARNMQVTDSYRMLQDVMRGFRNDLLYSLSPVILLIAKRFERWWMASRQLIQSQMIRFFQRLSDAIEAADRAVSYIGGWGPVFLLALQGLGLLVLITRFDLLVAVISTVSLKIKFLTEFLAGLGGALGLTGGALVEIAAIFAASFLAAFLIIEDIYTFLTGGDSIIGRIHDKLYELVPAGEKLREFWQALGRFVIVFIKDELEKAKATIRGLKPAFDKMLQYLDPVISKVRKLAEHFDSLRFAINLAKSAAAFFVGEKLGGAADFLNKASDHLEATGEDRYDAITRDVSSRVGDIVEGSTTNNSTSINSVTTLNADVSGRSAPETEGLLEAALRASNDRYSRGPR